MMREENILLVLLEKEEFYGGLSWNKNDNACMLIAMYVAMSEEQQFIMMVNWIICDWEVLIK